MVISKESMKITILHADVRESLDGFSPPCRPFLGKRYSLGADGKIKATPYDNAFRFGWTQDSISGIGGLANLLESLSRCGRRFESALLQPM
jgi:hypothetical protein